MALEKVNMKVNQAVEKMGELEAQVEDLNGQVLMLQDMVLRMNKERAHLVRINISTTEALHQSLVWIGDLATRVAALEHGPWNPVVINNDSNGEMVVMDEVVREENEVPIPVPPPGQLVEIVDYNIKCQGITPSNSKGSLPAPEAGVCAHKREQLRSQASSAANQRAQETKQRVEGRAQSQKALLRRKQKTGLTPSH